MGEGDQVREHQARVIPPRTCLSSVRQMAAMSRHRQMAAMSRHDSDEPITSGYVRSSGQTGHAAFALGTT